MGELPLNIGAIAENVVRELVESSSFTSFVSNAVHLARQKSTPQLLSISVPIEPLDPLAVLEWLGRKDDFRYFWEHPQSEIAISAGSSVACIDASGVDRFAEIASKIEQIEENAHHYSEVDHSLAGIHFLGGFSFTDDHEEQWSSFGDARFIVPRWCFVKDGKFGMVTVNAFLEPEESIEEFTSFLIKRLDTVSERLSKYLANTDMLSPYSELKRELVPEKAEWMKNISQAVDEIKEGSYKKTVLARTIRLTAKKEFNVTQALNSLRETYTSSFTFLVQFDENAAFLGSTPERILSSWSDIVQTEALAGSIDRGRTASEDVFYRKQLLSSEKDHMEHDFVVTALRDALEPICSKLEIPDQAEVKKYPNVQHLYSPIKGILKSQTNVLQVLEAIHPSPAVGGFPTEQSMSHIRRLEHFDRGWYAAPVGWICSSGRSEFSVAIRSALVLKNEAILYAGCGIVEGSDPEKEWHETQIKFIPMISALTHDAR